MHQEKLEDSSREINNPVYETSIESSLTRNNSNTIIPDYVKCPITLQIFRDPVMLVQTGVIVERAAAEGLVLPCNSPITNQPLTSKKFTPAPIQIKQAVEAYLERHPEKNNSEDRYPKYQPQKRITVTPTAPIRAPAGAVIQPNTTLAARACCCVGAIIILGGIITGIVFAIEAAPCRNEAWKNLTGETLSFTYPETHPDNDHKMSCIISPWENIINNMNIHLYRDGFLEHCTFYTTTGIQIHTTAKSVQTDGVDADGCSIVAKKASAKCSWDFYKSCPNDKKIPEWTDFKSLRGSTYSKP